MRSGRSFNNGCCRIFPLAPGSHSPGKRYAAIVAASIFAVAHLPNPILTAVTLIWGLVACFVFLRYRNLYTLAITHAILGICLAISVPGPVIRNMRVGLGYLTYPRHHLADLSVYQFDSAGVSADLRKGCRLLGTPSASYSFGESLRR